MQVKSDKIYIDYLDYTVTGLFDINKAVNRLRFDLLLFSEDMLQSALMRSCGITDSSRRTRSSS